MLHKPIITEPHAVLHTKTEAVPLAHISSPEIKRILREMAVALRATSDGIGIAAPQIGYSLSIFLASEEALKWEEAVAMDEKERKKKHWDYYTFINPVITKRSRTTREQPEGCLSVPGTYGTVRRAEKVTITAYDETGKKFTRGASKLYAQLMQHETDHLSGVLFISKARNLHAVDKSKPQPPSHL